MSARRLCPKCRGLYAPKPPGESLGNCPVCLLDYADVVALVESVETVEQPSASERDRHRFGHRGMLILSALLALSLGAGSAHAGSRAESYAIHCGLKAADLASTEIALARPGTFEGNPLMGNRGARLGIGLGSCVAVSELDHKLRKHRKSQWAVRILAGGLLAFAVQSNARVGR